ncbi:MAG: family 43 glycosylhydrolase [Cyclobacteriaceae bacterium]
MKLGFLLTPLLLLFMLRLSAQNPLITHMYTADPTARVFDGKLYVYPSSDVIPPEGIEAPRFCMPGYNVFTLEGGLTWKDHGNILDHNEVPWGVKDAYAMWAPDCIKKGDTYYYYFPDKAANDNAFRRIGVGTSKSPSGPFKWEKNFIEGVSGIDPGLFLDDDGTAYLYYGGGQELFVTPLKDNMKEIAAAPTKIEGLPAGYKEGSFTFKKDGKYYFTFAHVFPQEGYTIGYATGDNPFGPFEYRGKIMDNIDNGTNHHSIVKYQDRWILFYHFWEVSGFNKLRSMCADYMEFIEKDGSIRKVKPTKRGIGTAILGDTLQVDRYSEIHGAQTAFVGGNEPKGWMIAETRSYSWVRFDRVDFGKGEAKNLQVRMASGQRIGSIEFRSNHPKGDLIAEVPVSFTGGWNTWETKTISVTNPLSGVQNLVLVFKGEPGSTKVANVNWLIIE